MWRSSRRRRKSSISRRSCFPNLKEEWMTNREKFNKDGHCRFFLLNLVELWSELYVRRNYFFPYSNTGVVLQSSDYKVAGVKQATLFYLDCQIFVPFETLSFIECGLFLVVVYDWAIIIQVNSITQHKSLPESKFQEHVSTSFHSHSNTLDWRVKHNVKTLYMQYIKSTQGVHVMTYCFFGFCHSHLQIFIYL